MFGKVALIVDLMSLMWSSAEDMASEAAGLLAFRPSI
jgi:hypothetical protein